ncbi:MAG: hypothetical protein FFODKBPE_00375 [Candidatus Argoarchaeum ethanivorans]|uniref:Uncharacterized protein n=1 Tax=Candidatus Argoarchaeum ethanivorans TaxID=2608793 RepID=A0A811TB23_9EURY|nr:MAG: hypothetical protein FFODKBPE_00375 [Candidatus Argoarchaeum ethanivorans]
MILKTYYDSIKAIRYSTNNTKKLEIPSEVKNFIETMEHLDDDTI